MANLLPIPTFTALDGNGDPISGAKLYFYEAGTTTPADTYSDGALTSVNANPVIADGNGRFGAIYLQAIDYKAILKDASDVTIWTRDPVAGTLDVTGNDFNATQQSPADMTVLVTAGTLFNVVTKALTVKTAQTSSVIAAPTTDPRIDIVYIDRLTGVIGVATGAEAASPTDPTIPDDKLPICRVTLATTTTEIEDSLITDIRELNLLGSSDLVRYSFVDEDDMASDSAVLVPSQQSVKKYVDTADVPDASKAPPEISNGTDADHDIDIGSGYCRAENAAAKITNAALTKQLDAPWAAGTGAGGNDQAQLDGAQTVTFNDNGASPDDVTIDSGTWTYTPVAGDTLVVVGGTNAGSYQITAGTPTVINVATGSFAADAASASAIYVVKADATYHLDVIRNSTTGDVDAVFTESAGSPTNLPSGYDQYRRIGAVLTDGTANIIGFHQHENRFYWNDRVHDVDVANMGSTRQTPTISTPLGVEVIALLHAQMRLVGAATGVVNSPDDTDTAPSASHNDLQSENANARPATNMERKTNTSSQIAYRGDGSGANFDLWTLGWIDSRGRNA